MDDIRAKFLLDSDRRTQEYLINKKVVELSEEQTKKLSDLDKDMVKRKANATKGKETARLTGIPENIASLDVVRFALLLGLVKSKTAKNHVSLLDIFLGRQVKKEYEKRRVSFKDIPFYFNHHPYRVLEEQKLEWTSLKVEKECDIMNLKIQDILSQYKEYLNSKVVFQPSGCTIEAFKYEAIAIINDLVEGVLEEDADTHEMLGLISTIRPFLLGLMDLFQYMDMVQQHIRLMETVNADHSQYLTNLELTIMSRGSPLSISNVDKDRLYLELQLRCFTRDPQLKPIDLSTIIRNICCPSMVYVPLHDIIRYNLIGPYNNNPIAYINQPGAYYILKRIQNDVRLWVLDPYLINTIAYLRKEIGRYVRTIEWNLTDTLSKNLKFVTSNRFDEYVRRLISQESLLIPTELDVFNTLVTP